MEEVTAQAAVAADWSDGPEAVLRRLDASPLGLTTADVAERLRKFGPNALEDRDRAGPLKLLLRQVESPLVLILVFGACVAFTLGDITEGSIILAIVIGSTALGFAQEFHASRAIEALRQRMALKSRVLRDGAEQQAPAAEIVPGDVILLSAGNLVPADATRPSSR